MPPRQTVMKKPKDTKGTLRRILSYIAEYKLIILLVIILSITSNILALFGPKLAEDAINEAAAGIGQVNFERIWIPKEEQYFSVFSIAETSDQIIDTGGGEA